MKKFTLSFVLILVLVFVSSCSVSGGNVQPVIVDPAPVETIPAEDVEETSIGEQITNFLNSTCPEDDPACQLASENYGNAVDMGTNGVPGELEVNIENHLNDTSYEIDPDCYNSCIANLQDQNDWASCIDVCK